MEGKPTVSALCTDYYSLSVMQACFLEQKNPQIVCDVFFRKQPFDGGFCIFCGLEPLLQHIQKLRFTKKDISFLKKQKFFHKEFLSALEKFSFTGDIYAMQEGTVCFPNEPLLRIHTNMLEGQLIEALVLNTINYQTLIATKSARMNLSAGSFDNPQKKVIEFGLRRAPGIDGALSASRAAFVGGVSATSNVSAGQKNNIPVSGTMSHAWVMSFKTEREAFETYSKIYPNNTVFLLDTYNTLESGLPNAIAAGQKLKKAGKKFGVRLDSGDIEYLSQEVRKELNKAGLHDVFIVVSNELDEEIIYNLTARDCPVDVWGVGTHLVTGGTSSALAGVYKLSAIKNKKGEFVPAMKISNHIQKATLPCVKQVYRFSDKKTGVFFADLICVDGELFGNKKGKTSPITFYHPYIDKEFFTIRKEFVCRTLLAKVLSKGRPCRRELDLQTIQNNTKKQLSLLDKTSKRLLNPHIYPVSISKKLKKERDVFMKKKQY